MHTLLQVKDFSPHLFWDVDRTQVVLPEHQTWLVKRVLEKGLWSDWQRLLGLLGKDALRESVKSTRHLEARATSFACAVLHIDPSQLRCSTLKSSQTTPWNY